MGSFPKNKKVRVFLTVLVSFSNIIFCKIFLKLSILILILNIMATLIFLYFHEFYQSSIIFKNYIFFNFTKNMLIVTIIISFLFLCLSFFYFLNFNYLNYSLNCNNNFIFHTKIKTPVSIDISNLLHINLSVDFFSYIILFLCYLVGFFALLTVDTRLYWKNLNYMYFFNLFILVVFFFVSSTNILIFFLAYELLLMPSFFFVYFVSPGRRAIQASFYFLIWTQIGSFIVLIAISYCVFITNSFDFFSITSFIFSNSENNTLYLLSFLGFGIKIPIWPFHYWITKTHVEAPSGFSIYLSGFLVKTALFGFYKFSNILNSTSSTSIFLVITLMGIIDASIKMWGQNDLKKLVAYCTIQEMNIIFFLFCFGDIYLKEIGFFFSLTHALLSAIMFFLVDCIYRRYHSRSILQLNGLISSAPNLSICVFFMCIFFSGLPGTLKFYVELCVFLNLINFSFVSTILLVFFANCLGLIGFSKSWFNLLFGIRSNLLVYVQNDLSKKEILLTLTIFSGLFFFSFFINFFL